MDIPEILITLGLIGCLVWALYNWSHPQPKETK
jgi:hypothetical protein